MNFERKQKRVIVLEPKNMYVKNFLFVIILCFISACSQKKASIPFELPPEGPHSIFITVEGIRCCEGVLRLAVYNDAAYWLSETDIVRGRLGFIQSETQQFEVHGLPEGRYAIAAFQDLNNDSKLNRKFFVLPKEPYGFSNNVGRYGPASFNKAAFLLSEDTPITINLNSL